MVVKITYSRDIIRNDILKTHLCVDIMSDVFDCEYDKTDKKVKVWTTSGDFDFDRVIKVELLSPF